MACAIDMHNKIHLTVSISMLTTLVGPGFSHYNVNKVYDNTVGSRSTTK